MRSRTGFARRTEHAAPTRNGCFLSAFDGGDRPADKCARPGRVPCLSQRLGAASALAVRMQAFFRWLVSLFISPAGVIVLAALDSTVFVSLPFGIDAVVVILSAKLGHLGWIVPLLATAGSLGGAWITFWMGRKLGEKGLERYVSRKRLDRVRRKIERSGAVALAVLDL